MAEKRRSSLLEMIKGRVREFVREPSAFFFVVFMPLLWMAILGVAFSGKRAETYGVGWRTDGAAPGPVAETVHAALAKDPRVRLMGGSPPELTALLERGDVLLVVRPAAAGPWAYTFDPANREAAHARLAVDDLVQSAAGRRDPVPAVDEVVDVPGTRYIDFLVPGLVALSIMTTSLFGTGAVIVVNRRENLLKRYLATPMSPLAYIVSHMVGRGFMMVVEVATILLGGLAMFHFHVAGSLAAFAAVAAVGTGAFTALALLCASRTSSMAVMNGMTNLLSVPMMIVGGVWFARANFPGWMQGGMRLLPLTALVDALRRIALEGGGLGSVTFELAVLGVYLVAGTVLARALFKWY